jgi:hypothetical protein
MGVVPLSGLKTGPGPQTSEQHCALLRHAAPVSRHVPPSPPSSPPSRAGQQRELGTPQLLLQPLHVPFGMQHWLVRGSQVSPVWQPQVVMLPQAFVIVPHSVPAHVGVGQKQVFVLVLHVSPLVQLQDAVLPHAFMIVPHWFALQVGVGQEQVLVAVLHVSPFVH